MAWRAEFPDFPEADMPAIPGGFEDISWHNDACPYFWNEAKRWGIFIDYADPKMREMPNTDRFMLVGTDDAGLADTDQFLLSTNDWNAVIHKIADMEAELAAQGGCA